MMKKALYIFGLVTVLGICDANAGTDLLSNALTQSNSFLKEAGLVQKKYAGIARKLVTGKVEIIADQLKLTKLKKYKEKAESIKEKAKMLEERLKTYKEYNEQLQAKYDELNKLAKQYEEMASQAIYDSYEIKFKYLTPQDEEDTSGLLSEGLVGGDEAVPSSAPSSSSDVADAKTSDSVSDSSAPALAGDNSWQRSSSSSQAANQTAEAPLPQFEDAAYTEGQTSDAIEGPSDDIETSSSSSKNETIRSAERLASSQTTVGTSSVPQVTSSLMGADVSVSDIMSNAASGAQKASSTEQIQSPFNIQEQLQRSSNRTYTARPVQESGVQLSNDAVISSPLSRSRFDSSSSKEKNNAEQL